MNINDVFPSKFVKASDLNGRAVTVTIAKLTLETMGQDGDRKPVLWFERATKGLVVNRTNAMQIAAMYGPETDQWIGQRITIYPAKVRAFGATVDCIRVKAEVPRHHPLAQPAVPVVEVEAELDDPEDLFDHDGDEVAA